MRHSYTQVYDRVDSWAAVKGALTHAYHLSRAIFICVTAAAFRSAAVAFGGRGGASAYHCRTSASPGYRETLRTHGWKLIPESRYVLILNIKNNMWTAKVFCNSVHMLHTYKSNRQLIVAEIQTFRPWANTFPNTIQLAMCLPYKSLKQIDGSVSNTQRDTQGKRLANGGGDSDSVKEKQLSYTNLINPKHYN